MAHTGDIALMAHLMRRAGFGAGRDELEARIAKGYDATVEELLNLKHGRRSIIIPCFATSPRCCCPAECRRWATSTTCITW